MSDMSDAYREMVLEKLAALEKERDNWRQCAEERQRAAEQQAQDKQAVASERDAALADNAALWRDVREAHDVMAEAWPGRATVKVLAATLAVPHPGAAVLEEHRKALARARNEGLEKAAKQVDMMELAAIHVAAGSMAAPVAAGEAHIMGRAARQVAHAIRAMKEPES